MRRGTLTLFVLVLAATSFVMAGCEAMNSPVGKEMDRLEKLANEGDLDAKYQLGVMYCDPANSGEAGAIAGEAVSSGIIETVGSSIPSVGALVGLATAGQVAVGSSISGSQQDASKQKGCALVKEAGLQGHADAINFYNANCITSVKDKIGVKKTRKSKKKK